jgi:hypothetical protein
VQRADDVDVGVEIRPFSTETRTSIWRARWKQTSGSNLARTARPASVRNVADVQLRRRRSTFSRVAAREVVEHVHLVAAATSASTRFEPMKPAPPVYDRPHAPYRTAAVFLTFEGVDGSGKTTQAKLLVEALRADGRDVVATREPAGTPARRGGPRAAARGSEMSAWAETTLFAARRAELADRVIAPALKRGQGRRLRSLSRLVAGVPGASRGASASSACSS